MKHPLYATENKKVSVAKKWGRLEALVMVLGLGNHSLLAHSPSHTHVYTHIHTHTQMVTHSSHPHLAKPLHIQTNHSPTRDTTHHIPLFCYTATQKHPTVSIHNSPAGITSTPPNAQFTMTAASPRPCGGTHNCTLDTQ